MQREDATVRTDSEAVVRARRALGQRAQRAREAADCKRSELAANLNMTDQDLAAFEAGCAVEGAGVAKISRVLGREVKAKSSGEIEKLNNWKKALGELAVASRELGRLEIELSATAQRLKDQGASVQEFDDAVSVVESCRMLALKRARGRTPSAAILGDLLTDRGVWTSQGRPIREQTIWKHENPDRDEPRPPDQAYVNGVICVLVDCKATRRADLDCLRVVDEIFRALNVLASHNRALSRWAVPSDTASPIDLVDVALRALRVPAGDDRPRTVPSEGQAPIPPAVPAPQGAPIPPSRRGRSWRRAVVVAVGVAAAIFVRGIDFFPAVCAPRISTPSDGADALRAEPVAGSAAGCGDRLLWLVSEPVTASHAYWPQQQVVVSAGKWSGSAYVGDQHTPVGVRFAIDLVAVDADGNRAFTDYLNSVPRPGLNPYPGLQVLPAQARVLAQVIVTRG
jgi:hypothetical protein